MRFITCAQGTPEWHQARAGVVTASCFVDAVSTLSRTSGKRKAGDPSIASDKYAADLAIERISGKPYGAPVKAWVLDRGHEMERLARMAYEARTESMVTEAGLVLTDDGLFGYSTDGFVGNDGLIEIKAPIDSVKIVEILETGDLTEYMHQMQGGMWITARKWCDFIMYVPDLANAGSDLYIKRVMRDDNFIDAMVLDLAAFARRVSDREILFKLKEAA